MKRLSSLIVVIVLSVLSLRAQSLDECRRLAREHYPEIRQYDLIAQTEQYNLSNAARAWLPQVSLSAQASWQTATPTFPEQFSTMLAMQGIEMTGLQRDQYQIALNVSQNIWDGGQTRADREIAHAEATEQRNSIDVDLYDLQARIDGIYFGILLLDARIAQTELRIELLKNNLKTLRSYVRNGVAMQADADALEAEILSTGQTLEQTKTSRGSYRHMLELFIGRPLTDTVLQIPPMPDIRSHESARPELALFDAGIAKLSAQEKRIQSSTMPRFSVFAQGYYGYPGMDMFKSMMSEDWSWNAMVGIRMTWNFGTLYTQKNNLRKLLAAKEQLEIQRDIFLFNTELQTIQDNGEIARLHKAVADDERIVELRRSVRMAAESQLSNGVINTTDLLQKIADETTAMLTRSTHEIELLQTIYSLKHTLNQ